MAQTNATLIDTQTPAPKDVPRFTSVQPRVQKKSKIDRKEIIDNWTIKTNIIDRIKKLSTNKIHTIVIEEHEYKPEVYLDLLTLNDMGKNRYLKEAHIADLAEEIKSGNFPANGDTFGVSKTYKLIDGQHRLWAAWDAQKSIPLIITTGLDDKVMAFKDIGENRSAHDLVVINQFGKNGTSMASAIKNIIYFKQTGKVSSSLSKREVRNRLVQNFLKNKTDASDLNDYIDFGKTANEKVKKWLSPAQWGFVYYTLTRLNFDNPEKSRKDVYRFLTSFYEGTDMSKDNPIMILRNLFLSDFRSVIRENKRNRIAGGHVTMKIKFIFEAWNQWFKTKNAKIKELEVDLQNPIIEKPLFR